jgi:hypothetical protein
MTINCIQLNPNLIMLIPSSLKEPSAMSLQELKAHIQRKDLPLPIEENNVDSEALVLQDLRARHDQEDLAIDEYLIRLEHKEREIAYWKEEIKEATKAKRSAEIIVDTIKSAFKSIKRNILAPEDKVLSGKFYQAEFAALPTTSPMGIKFFSLKKFEDFTKEQQNLWWIQKETIEEKKVVISSVTGEHINTDTSPTKIKQETILNQDALRNAYNSNQEIPDGIRAVPSIRLTTKRISPKLEMEAS